MGPTPVHGPVWRAVHDAVHEDVWAALGGGEYNYLILDDLGPLLLAEGDYLILE